MNVEQPALPQIQHLTITFPPGEGDRVRSYYAEVLGFREKPVPKVVKPLGWIWFQTADSSVELHVVPGDDPVGEHVRHHFCINVPDLEGCRARIESAGYPVIEAKPLPLRPRFFTRDPFGNLIEVLHLEGDYVHAGEAASL